MTTRALCIAFCVLSWAGLQGQELPRFEFEHPQMGTLFRFALHAPDEGAAKSAFAQAVKRIDDLNAALSDYLSDSELSKLSDTAGSGRPKSVSDDLWRVMEAAREVSERSDGAFDVSLGAVIKLWRRARRAGELPDPARRREALASAGWRNIRLIPEGRRIELTAPGTRLDLGGIAKGFAVDEALAVLAKAGVRRALVSGGGDVRAIGLPPGRDGWRVEIRQLEDAQPITVEIGEIAISTSGDLNQHVEIAGQRYSHIVDPETGLGLTARRSASVAAPTSTLADALATACTVLPAEKSRILLERHYPNVGARILEKRGDEIVETIIGKYPVKSGQ